MNPRGQSLVEILIAMAVGVIMILAAIALITPSLKSTSLTEQTQTASALGKELLESTRVLAEANWHNIDTLSTSSANTYFLDSESSPYIVLPGIESVLPDAPVSGLLAYWKLDGITSTVAYDYSGNGFTAALTGPIPTSSCIAADCLRFGGANFVMSPNLGDPLTSVTLAAWIKPDPAGGVVFTELGQPSINTGWHDSQVEVETDNTIQVCIRTTSEVCVVAGTGIVYGQWYHVVMRYDGTNDTLTGFVNGVAGGSTVTAKNAGSKQYYALGANDTNHGKNGNNYSGLIDDARIYNRALTDAEVKTLYNARIYTRYFSVSDVFRNSANKNIDPSGTLYDPSTKKITVVYNWAKGSSTIGEYLTRSMSSVFTQTDWSGGPGQSGPATSTNSQFSSSANINYVGNPGSITIANVTNASSGAMIRTISNTAAQSACAVTFPSSNAGDLIVVTLALDNGAVAPNTPTDSVGNTYNLAVGPAYYPAINETIAIWYAQNIVGRATVVSVTWAGSLSGECVGTEYTGMKTALVLDAGTSATASSSALNSGNVATNYQRDLIYGFGVVDAPGRPLSAGTGFTLETSTDSGETISEDKLVSATGTYSVTANASGSAGWIMGAAAFKLQ